MAAGRPRDGGCEPGNGMSIKEEAYFGAIY
jgi:hypothetical protein